jgi:hypothetical protein
MFAYASGSGQVPASVVPLTEWEPDCLHRESADRQFLLPRPDPGHHRNQRIEPDCGSCARQRRRQQRRRPDRAAFARWRHHQPKLHECRLGWFTPPAMPTMSPTSPPTARPGTGSGYLYKISNVFNGSAPTMVWSVAIDAVPSTPVFDSVTNQIFFTDSSGSHRLCNGPGTSPSVVNYTAILASGNTAENPVVLDSTNQMVYATFNSNGTNALVVQAPTSMASSVAAPVGRRHDLQRALRAGL